MDATGTRRAPWAVPLVGSVLLATLAVATVGVVRPASGAELTGQAVARTAPAARATAPPTPAPTPRVPAPRSLAPRVLVPRVPAPRVLTPRSPAPRSPAPVGTWWGPLFPAGLEAPHTCSAGVVHSASGDVVVTAAHCLSGSGAGMVFAPGYRDGVADFGTWVVTAAYVDAAWTATQDPRHDVAFLALAPGPTGPVEGVVGAAVLGVAPAVGTAVTVTAYAEGLADSALVCTGSTSLTAGYPTFTCGGFPGGTSGGPWVEDGVGGPTLVGVIGGLHQGGCTSEVSYSPSFSTAEAALLRRAGNGAPGDVLPAAGSDGC